MSDRDRSPYRPIARGGLIGAAAGVLIGLILLALPLQMAPEGQYQEGSAKAQCATTDKCCEAQSTTPYSPRLVPISGQSCAGHQGAQYASGQKAFWKMVWSTGGVLFGSRFFTDARMTDVLLAAFTGYLAWVTRGLWTSTKGLEKEAGEQHATLRDSVRIATEASRAAARSADAALVANQVSRDAMIADQRPWVSVEIELVSGLTWNENGASVTFKFILSNSGRTPALFTRVDAKFYSHWGFGVAADQRAFAAQHSTRRGEFLNSTIFPGQTLPLSISFSIPDDEIARAAANLTTDNPELAGWASPHLIGCASYESVLGGPRHQSGFTAELRRGVPLNPGGVVISRALGDIPIHELRFMRGFEDGHTD